MTFFGAVSQPDQTAAAVMQVIADLLHRLGGDRRQAWINAGGQARIQLPLKGIDQYLTHNGLSEIAVWLLGQNRIEIVALLAQERDLILVPSQALDLTCVGQQHASLSDEIQGDVG